MKVDGNTMGILKKQKILASPLSPQIKKNQAPNAFSLAT
jgi:hypothetical protein